MKLGRVSEKGFALVLVLWVLSLLTIMAGSFALSMSRETAIIEGVKHNAETQSVAESAIALAQIMLLNPDVRNRWRADGGVYQIDFADASVRIRMLSESGKIDLNTSTQKLLESLLSHAPLEDKQQRKLLNAILDWRDADEEVRQDGAELQEYKHAKLSYGPRNKRFHSIEELQMVLGMDPETFNWLAPLITVYAGQEIDLKLATREVLAVLPDIDASKIDEFLQARQQSAINGLPIPNFPANGSEVNVDAAAEPVEEAVVPDETADGTATQDVDVDVGVVEMIAEVQVDGEPNTMVSVVVEKSDTGVGSPFKVLKWHRNYASDVSLFADEMSEFLIGQYAEPQLYN